jgi:hypothetical protein
MSRDDHLVRAILVDGVFDRLEWIGVDDGAARGDARLVQEVEGAAQAPLGARAPAVRVDDETRAWLVLRTDDGDADGPLLRALAEGVDERPPRDGLVGDDEDVTRLANG